MLIKGTGSEAVTIGSGVQDKTGRWDTDRWAEVMVTDPDVKTYNDINGSTRFTMDVTKDTIIKGVSEVKFTASVNYLKEALANGEVDCLWSGFMMNGREDKYTWARLNLFSRLVAVVRADSDYADLPDLTGCRAAVQATTWAEYLLLRQETPNVLRRAIHVVVAVRLIFVAADDNFRQFVRIFRLCRHQKKQRKQEKQRTAPPDKPPKIPLLFTHVFCPYASCRTASSTICCCCVTAS